MFKNKVLNSRKRTLVGGGYGSSLLIGAIVEALVA